MEINPYQAIKKFHIPKDELLLNLESTNLSDRVITPLVRGTVLAGPFPSRLSSHHELCYHTPSRSLCYGPKRIQ